MCEKRQLHPSCSSKAGGDRNESLHRVCSVVHNLSKDLCVQNNNKFLEAEHIQALVANQDLQVRTAPPDLLGGTLHMLHSVVIKPPEC